MVEGHGNPGDMTPYKNKFFLVNNALQLSLHWEGDLRILSYFLNKRKELEFKTEVLLTFNIW